MAPLTPVGQFIQLLFAFSWPIEHSLYKMNAYAGMCNKHYGMLRRESEIIPHGGESGRKSPLRNFYPLELKFPAGLTDEAQIAVAGLISSMNKELNPRHRLIYYSFDGSNHCRERDGWPDVCFLSFPKCVWRDSKRSYICAELPLSNTTASTNFSRAYNIAITEADIALNLKASFWEDIEEAARNDLTPFLTVLKHEILHALGFAYVETGVMKKFFSAEDIRNNADLREIEAEQLESWNCITDSLFAGVVPFIDMIPPEERYYEKKEYIPNEVDQKAVLDDLSRHPYFKNLFDRDIHSFFYAESPAERAFKRSHSPMTKETEIKIEELSPPHQTAGGEPSCGVQ